MLKKIYIKLSKFERQFDTLNRIEISRSAILYNLDVYRKLNPKAYIFPVLKSNAYGHGLQQVAEILNTDKLLKYICVDSYYEYLKIKSYLHCKTLIIGYTKLNNYKYFDFKKITPVIFDLESIKVLSLLKKKISIHLKIDSGMNRQGILLSDLQDFLIQLKKCKNIRLEGVMTHLADADNPLNQIYTQNQIKIFKRSIQILNDYGFKPKYVHLSNSAGGLKINDSKFNSIRLGLGMYGYSPLEPDDPNYHNVTSLKPCLRLISTISQIKNIQKGAKVSYNLRYEAENDKKIAIIPAGYYEGIDRRLSNIGFFSQNSDKLRILGRVCMNLTIIDISNTTLKQGDEIILIDNNPQSINSVYNLAKLCKTIPYVITTKLAESIRRVIVD